MKVGTHLAYKRKVKPYTETLLTFSSDTLMMVTYQ